MQTLEHIFSSFAGFMWGTPLVVLLVGGGVFFALYSRFLPYRHFVHAIAILGGKYNNKSALGDISHFQALSAALSGTLGLGNIAGVALAISMGGPGAVFWMWVTALLGVATKFYTCSLGIMYRGKDSQGNLQGGPMYVIREGLGQKWWPLASLFAIAGLFGTLPIFQANQLVQLLREVVAEPLSWSNEQSHFYFDLSAGVLIAFLVLIVALGNIQRVGRVASTLVPAMVLFYFVLTFSLLVQYAAEIPAAFALIFRDAFSGESVMGGAVGAVILMGVRRGAFSNEAGIGTEVMAHGNAKTNEPIREGLVAMLGPVIDTLIVCTCTALAILVTGTWLGEGDGITLTYEAFEKAFPDLGGYALLLMVICLSLSTMFTFWYYGSKCLGFLIGAQHQHHYLWIYSVLVILGSVASLDMVLGLVDGMYALMAIPTMLSTLLLAKKVNQEAKRYFAKL